MSAEDEVFLISLELTSECPLNCPFCYFKRRFKGRAVKWRVEEVAALAREAREIWGPGGFVIVFGGGEPFTDPVLLGAAMRAALDEGSLYTSFTSDGILLTHETARVFEDSLGGPAGVPDAFANLSIDSYKLVAGPRARAGEVAPALREAWRETYPWLYAAARRYGVPPTRLREPPVILRAATVAAERGWDIAFNVMVTDDILPLLVPENPWSPRVTGPMIFLYALLEYTGALQVQFLAPKPLRGYLSVAQEPGPRYRGPALPALAAAAYWWSAHGPAKLYFDQAMARIMGLNVPAPPGKYCAAGARLISLDPAKHAAPCSFAPHSLRWEPGKLREIVEALGDKQPVLREGCPYL